MKRLLLLLLVFLPHLRAQSVMYVRDTSNNLTVSPGDSTNRAMRVNVVAGGGAGGTSSTFGAAFPGTGTAAGFSDGSLMQPGKISAAGNIQVECAVGCSASAGFADNSAFTFGTTAVTPVGYVFDDVAPNAATENRAAAPRMSGNRVPYSQLRDAAGNERGANVNASNQLTVSVDNTVTVASHAVTNAGTFAVQNTANASTNVTQWAGTATDVNSGTKSAGTLRVVLATDQPALTNKLLVTPDSVALPANQSVNVAQLAGTTTDTNSGNKSAGTLRVVLATDQPALTAKLLVTPDSVALPANQSVNVAQINGVTTLMGNGTTGTGSQRVTIASDNTAFAVNATLSAETTKVIGTARVLGNAGAAFDAATGAAPPANGVLMAGLTSGATGGFLTAVPVCDSFYNVNIVTATTTSVISGVSGRHVRICSINLFSAGTQNVGIISGTGASCGTGSAAIVGTTAATGYNFVAQTGIAAGSGIGTIMRTVATGDSVCIISSAAVQLSGVIGYTIY